MKCQRPLLILIAFFSWAGVTPFAAAQQLNLEYSIRPPRPLAKGEILVTDFFTQNPQALADAKSSPPDDIITKIMGKFSANKTPRPLDVPCDDAHGCHSISQTAQILDCRDKRAIGCVISHITEETPAPGYTSVEVLENGKTKVGWMRTGDLMVKPVPFQSQAPAPAPKSSYCVECSFKMNYERLKTMSHNILGKAKQQAPPPPPAPAKPALTGFPAIYKLFTSNRKFSALCDDFVTPDLKFGPMGQYIHKMILRYPGFHEPGNGVEKVCPNYSQFSPDQKADYFTYIFTAMVLEEGGCRKDIVSSPEVTAINPSGESMGYLQLDSRPDLNRNHDRQAGQLAKKKPQIDLDPTGFSAQKVCSVGSILNPRVNLRCGISIMNIQLIREKNVFAKSSFWSVIRDLQDAPYQTTKIYPGCRGAFEQP